MGNVTELPTKPDEMLAAVASLRRNLPALLEHMAIVAEMKRAYYNGLITQGFSAEQALELCKHPASF